MADTELFDPRTVPHTLWRIKPGHGHTIPIAPHILVKIDEENISRCVVGGEEEILDLTEHVEHYRAGVQLGVVAINTTWAFVFTPKGFEAQLCIADNDMLKEVISDERNTPRFMEQVSILLGVIADVFLDIGLFETHIENDIPDDRPWLDD